MKIKTEIGVLVQYCGHAGWFMADILRIGPVAVVNAGHPVSPDNLERGMRLGSPSHRVVDFPIAGFWQPRKGVFVVPGNQVTRIEAVKGAATK